MTDLELLKEYRYLTAEIKVLRRQLDGLLHPVLPEGRVWRLGQEERREKNLDSVRQLAEDAEERQGALCKRFEEVVNQAQSGRVRLILRQYYALGMTDEEIAESMGRSVKLVNDARNKFLKKLKGAASV